MAVNMSWATVITDASFCHKAKVAGWASWIRIDGLSCPIKRYGSFKTMPENSIEAEKMASINGMWIAKQFGADAILLQTDCLSVVHLIDGTTKQRKLKDKWTRDLASCGLLGTPIRAKHVRGHTNTDDARSFVNRWCDSKAKEAMKEARQ